MWRSTGLNSRLSNRYLGGASGELALSVAFKIYARLEVAIDFVSARGACVRSFGESQVFLNVAAATTGF